MHLAEEDTPETMVFCPVEAEARPSRGRLGIDLAPGARASVTSIGRGDSPETTSGSWRLVGPGGDQLELALASGETRRFEIVHLERDRLVLKK